MAIQGLEPAIDGSAVAANSSAVARDDNSLEVNQDEDFRDEDYSDSEDDLSDDDLDEDYDPEPMKKALATPSAGKTKSIPKPSENHKNCRNKYTNIYDPFPKATPYYSPRKHRKKCPNNHKVPKPSEGSQLPTHTPPPPVHETAAPKADAETSSPTRQPEADNAEFEPPSIGKPHAPIAVNSSQLPTKSLNQTTLINHYSP
ncbi:hypothetical protein DSO57_1030344 [Entomophthora muscae]|uniref:Uncharacterized protein n=1 Tax=Entomophthora muscae TaxID=34485 RepID=A0ACC2RRU9_9FUNG|nr:hypothetical protein DSO57_1030344 [Entomophthora muscae]